MNYVFVQDAPSAEPLRRALVQAPRIALDCEAAGFHRYSNRLCLVQISTPDETWIVDPLALDPSELLRVPLESPEVEIVMHGADFDLRLLQRDLGIRLRGLFDTQIAATLLGVSQIGLAALLEARRGVKLSKKYQRADWAERPLSEGMLEYAAADTAYLLGLAEELKGELEAAGRLHWALEECRALEEAAAEPMEDPEEPVDPVTRVKGARDLPAREVTVLREALAWRDEIARRKDRAPFRVVGDGPLVEAALRTPEGPAELANIQGFPRGVARSDGHRLLRRLERARALPEEDLVPYPRNSGRGPGRPPPEVEALAERLKQVRNRKADELGIDRGFLLSNALLTAIAWQAPRTPEELLAVDGMRRWRLEALGDDLLAVLRR